MAAWYDDPCFDDASDMAGVYEFRGDSWRRLQSLKERGVPCDRVVEVAGVTFRKTAIDGVLRAGVGAATLEAEPDNKCDSNAIKVKVNDAHVGYIPARMAMRLHTSSVTPHVCAWLADRSRMSG
jgi:hypothetical protein